MESMEYDYLRGEESFEAMETSFKNSSVEDMEIEESAKVVSHIIERNPHAIVWPNSRANSTNSSSTDCHSNKTELCSMRNAPIFSKSPLSGNVFSKRTTNCQLSPGIKQENITVKIKQLNGKNIKREHQDSIIGCVKNESENVEETWQGMRPLQIPSSRRKRKHQVSLNSKSQKTDSKSTFSFSKSFLFLSSVVILSSFFIHIYLEHSCKELQIFNEHNLRKRLEDHLFGQELAIKIIPSLFQEYFSKLGNDDIVAKPLVLSIHGWTGVGKNYVSHIVSDIFESKTFTKFIVPQTFIHKKDDYLYSNQIVEWVKTNFSRCSVNFFLFDEMDKASPGVVSGLQSAILSMQNSSFPNTPVIFLLLSNSMGAEINKVIFTSGRQRDEINMDNDLRTLFQTQDEWFSGLASQGLIDSFIPFLPLEEAHVIECIKQDLSSKNLVVNQRHIRKVLNEMTFVSVPGTQKMYSSTGCKRVSDKVNLVVYDDI